VCRTLDEIVPATIALANGSGASSGFSIMLCNRPRPLVMSAQFFGCIGQMLPAVMGASVATGKKPMLLIDGDASTMMHLSDFDTAVRYQIPVLVVVLNDQALGSEYHKMVAHKMKAQLSTIPTPDMGAVGKALGGRGALVKSIQELRSAVAEWVAKPGPMIVDARITRNVPTLAARRIIYARDE
jgi:thiamine pyrophosphate-dependent acetolactate synthase large subunit-like protein